MFISADNRAILLANAESFAWRLALVVAAYGVDFASANLHLLSVPATATVFIGLLLGEAHDFLNQKYGIDTSMAKAIKSVMPSKKR